MCSGIKIASIEILTVENVGVSCHLSSQNFHLCAHARVHTCTCVWLRVHASACVCVCVYVCGHVCASPRTPARLVSCSWLGWGAVGIESQEFGAAGLAGFPGQPGEG